MNTIPSCHVCYAAGDKCTAPSPVLQRFPACCVLLTRPYVHALSPGRCFYDGRFFFMVEILKGRYKGQKLIKLVATKTMASMPSIMAAVPVICPVK